ncbi:MAG TPA: ROK family protein [Anaerolineales bacterium]
MGEFRLIPAAVQAPLDPGFRPAALANRSFAEGLGESGTPLVIGLQRSGGQFSRYELSVLPDDHPEFEQNLPYVERIVKFLLWQRGGSVLHIGGSDRVAAHMADVYSAGGPRSFDYRFMGEQVYEREFRVVACPIEEVRESRESGRSLGRHLNGNRIGFDLGASDRKVSAVVEGLPVFSEEIPWQPRAQSDPEYHYREIMAALKAAASRLPRVDAIGGSSAGIYIDNRPMVASLFRGVPAERYGEIRELFLRIRAELGVPLEVINDGDVTALAGSMSIEDNGILGIAMGSSEAAGYVDLNGHILGWLNELAFAPIDYSPEAPVEEWSGDRGCGASYLSQQCVFRLAPRAGIEIPDGLLDVDRLEFVRHKLEAGHAGARSIWETLGVYLGYALAHYADFYDIKHVLVLGRCTSGAGGPILLERADDVLRREFPGLAEKIMLHLPDEKVRRIGQSVAAASLPALDEMDGNA